MRQLALAILSASAIASACGGDDGNVASNGGSGGWFWHPIAARSDLPELLIVPVLDYAEVTASVYSAETS